jgi:hypothetical protein
MLEGRHRLRFSLAYALLAVGGCAFFLFGVRSLDSARETMRAEAAEARYAGQRLDAWQPKAASALKAAAEIARHVRARYRAADGKPLLPAPSIGRPTDAHMRPLTHVVFLGESGSPVRMQPLSQPLAALEYALPGTSERGLLGSPLGLRSRLLRMQALELALRSLHARSELETVLVYLPPTEELDQPTLLYFRRSELEQALERPLSATVGRSQDVRARRPLSERQRVLVDELTLGRHYTYQFVAGQDGSNAVLLSPLPPLEQDALRH